MNSLDLFRYMNANLNDTQVLSGRVISLFLYLNLSYSLKNQKIRICAICLGEVLKNKEARDT